MSKKEAESVMSQFRNGELNILVSTSVLSEGIDVPECNGVIRYMFVSDVIADVQIPGNIKQSFFPRLLFYVYIESPNTKEPGRPHNTGPILHQLKTPTPNPDP